MFEDSSFKKMMEMMNRHVPPKRRSLSDLLGEKDPSYSGRDGNVYHIAPDELQLLSNNLSRFDWPKLKLPIILMTDTSYEQGGAWKVMGKAEASVVASLIGKKAEKEDEIRLFHPHMVELRRKLPTATTCMYMP